METFNQLIMLHCFFLPHRVLLLTCMVIMVICVVQVYTVCDQESRRQFYPFVGPFGYADGGVVRVLPALMLSLPRRYPHRCVRRETRLCTRYCMGHAIR